MARTTADLVKAVLGDNYGKLGDDTLPSLTPFVDAASLVVDRVSACAAAKGVTLSAAELEVVERWLAAHLYTRMDLGYQSKATDKASATFQGQTGMHLDASYYGQTAQALDPSGCLAAIGNRRVAGGFWAGMTPRALDDYLSDQQEL